MVSEVLQIKEVLELVVEFAFQLRHDARTDLTKTLKGSGLRPQPRIAHAQVGAFRHPLAHEKALIVLDEERLSDRSAGETRYNSKPRMTQPNAGDASISLDLEGHRLRTQDRRRLAVVDDNTGPARQSRHDPVKRYAEPLQLDGDPRLVFARSRARDDDFIALLRPGGDRLDGAIKEFQRHADYRHVVVLDECAIEVAEDRAAEHPARLLGAADVLEITVEVGSFSRNADDSSAGGDPSLHDLGQPTASRRLHLICERRRVAERVAADHPSERAVHFGESLLCDPGESAVGANGRDGPSLDVLSLQIPQGNCDIDTRVSRETRQQRLDSDRVINIRDDERALDRSRANRRSNCAGGPLGNFIEFDHAVRHIGEKRCQRFPNGPFLLVLAKHNKRRVPRSGASSRNGSIACSTIVFAPIRTNGQYFEVVSELAPAIGTRRCRIGAAISSGCSDRVPGSTGVGEEHRRGFLRELLKIPTEQVELRQEVIPEGDDVGPGLDCLDDVKDLASRGPQHFDMSRLPRPVRVSATIGIGSVPASAMRPAKIERIAGAPPASTSMA